MPTIRIKIDDDLKKLMDKHKSINWSEVIRQAIIETIQKQQKSNLAKAVLINEEICKKAPDSFDSTEIIRKFRDDRTIIK